MFASSTYDKDGWLRVEPVDDRCAHYTPNVSLLNLHRCVCCVYFDSGAQRCRNPQNRIDAIKERERSDGERQ